MTFERLRRLAQEKLSLFRQWMDETLTRHARLAKPTAAFEFDRLARYFTTTLLEKTYVVVVRELPLPPFKGLGLEELEGLGAAPAAAITYRNFYFIHPDCVGDEVLHFHELIHVIQWHELGVNGFLLAYAHGLLTVGYLENPLEVQAGLHERRFRETDEPYDVSNVVSTELRPTVDVLSRLNLDFP